MCEILPVHIAAPSKTAVNILNQTLSKTDFFCDIELCNFQLSLLIYIHVVVYLTSYM